MADRVLLAIPAYNEEATIRDVVEAVRHEAPAFDVIVVDDGSRDRTPDITLLKSLKSSTLMDNSAGRKKFLPRYARISNNPGLSNF